MAMPPRISTGSSSSITYTPIAGVPPVRPTQETVPFNSTQLLNADNLLREMELNRQQVLTAVVKRVTSQLQGLLINNLLINDVPGAEVGAKKHSISASPWMLVLDLGGKELLLGSDVALKIGQQVTLRLDASGQLVLDKLKAPFADTSIATLAAGQAEHGAEMTLTDSLRFHLPRQEAMGVVVQKLLALMASLNLTSHTTQTAQTAAQEDIETTPLRQLLQQVQQWTNRSPDIHQLLKQPVLLQQHIQQAGPQLEKKLADILRALPEKTAPVQRVAATDSAIEAAIKTVQQQDNKAVLLTLIQQVKTLLNSEQKIVAGLILGSNALHEPEISSLLGNHADKSVLEHVQHLLQSALSRIVVQQLQVVMDNQQADEKNRLQHQALPAQQTAQHQHVDLVIRHGQQHENIPLHIWREPEKDGEAGGAVRKGERAWRVAMDFDLGEMGRMQAQIRTTSQGTSIVFQCQNPLLEDIIHKQQQLLEQRLLKRGVPAVNIQHKTSPQEASERAAMSDIRANALASVLHHAAHSFIDVHT
jgi:hypothetical protein